MQIINYCLLFLYSYSSEDVFFVYLFNTYCDYFVIYFIVWFKRSTEESNPIVTGYNGKAILGRREEDWSADWRPMERTLINVFCRQMSVAAGWL